MKNKDKKITIIFYEMESKHYMEANIQSKIHFRVVTTIMKVLN